MSEHVKRMINRRHILKLYSGFLLALDWVFPPKCIGCGIEKEHFCKTCLEKINYLNKDVCQFCGSPIRFGTTCNECLREKPHYDQLRSVSTYTPPISNAIRLLKYQRDITLGLILSQLMAKKVVEMNWKVDMVLAVPMSPKHFQERGYNQAAVLAYPISLLLDLDFESGAIIKKRETKTQVGLSAKERKMNVENAFFADSKIVSGKNVLVVDDVSTTGATINACSYALRQAGAALIYAITLGKAAFSSSPLELQS